MVGSNNGIQPLRCPTSHVPPLLSSVLCSNNQNFSLFSGGDDLSMPLSNEKHMNQYGVDPSTPQTLSADELKALTTRSYQSKHTPPLLAPRSRKRSSKTKTKINHKRQMDNKNDNDNDTSLMDLSRRLRTNLSLAKQRMMTGLKQSTEPNDIAMYTQLENITLEDSPSSSPPPPPLRRVTSTTISKTVGNGRNLFPYHSHYSTRHPNDKYRVHKKKPYNNCSSYMELQSNPNGYVSVVLRKSSTSSTKEAYATLTRSFSFTMRDSDSDSDSDSDEDTTMDEASAAVPPPPPTDLLLTEWMATMAMDQSNNNVNNNNNNVLSSTWMQQVLSLEPQGQDPPFYHLGDSTMDENNIDSWLQRGGLGCSPMAVATDQELAGKALECLLIGGFTLLTYIWYRSTGL